MQPNNQLPKILTHNWYAEHYQFPVRTAVVNGVTVISCVDACAAIGYQHPAKSWPDLKYRNPELHKYLTTVKMTAVDGKLRDTDCFPIEGLIRLCMIAKTMRAERFREWATDTLTQTITQAAMPTHLETARNLVAALERAEAAEQALAIAAPLADVATTISLSPNWITLANAAKMLATKARPVGSHRLAQYLRDKGYFIREISASGNECGTEPKQEYVDRGYFKRQYVARKGSAHGSFDPCTVISGKFMVKLTQMWNEDFGGTK